jgi:hypothetical protein
MPVFSDAEYDDFDLRPDFETAWRRLPVLATIGGIKVRWLGPLVDLGHDVWLSELSQGAYGHLEDCGWSDLLPEGSVTGPGGRIRRTWAKGFAAAVEVLAEAGSAAGPESDPERWASWLAFELADLHAVVRARAAAKDAER